MDIEKIRAMLEMQDDLNREVNANWLKADYPWTRAIMMEAAEALEHHGWKWWKKQKMDLPNLQIELVDIWHFALSFVMSINPKAHLCCAGYIKDEIDGGTHRLQFDSCAYKPAEMDVASQLELMIGIAAAGDFNIPLFGQILRDCGMSWDDLYRLYVGKNVLNKLRQNYGYATGTYRKVWAGREDNEHLTEILATLDSDAWDFKQLLYAALLGRFIETAP